MTEAEIIETIQNPPPFALTGPDADRDTVYWELISCLPGAACDWAAGEPPKNELQKTLFARWSRLGLPRDNLSDDPVLQQWCSPSALVGWKNTGR